MNKAEIIQSFAGRPGPKLRSGLTPSQLGWGSEDKAYPEGFTVNETDGAELVWVPAGEFSMGTLGAEIADMLLRVRSEIPPNVTWLPDDERPCHKIKISKGFWLYKNPVTRGQFKRLMGDYPRNRESWMAHMLGGKADDPNRQLNDEPCDDHPVVWIDWHNASDYATRAGASLPTEGQWEYAARGPFYRKYPWGNEWDASRCQSAADRHGFRDTAPVGSFPGGASWCGALDLAGNVWEWCRDWFAPYPDDARPIVDPEGIDAGSGRRILRGGSWLSAPLFQRCSARIKAAPRHAFNYYGFRCMAR